MIKVINHVRYNTETSEEVASYYNGIMGFAAIEESVYKTRSGKYFFYGWGGSLTKYKALDKNPDGSLTGGYTEGYVLEPLTKEQAMNKIKGLQEK